MSQPSRPRACGPQQRRRRDYRLDALSPLEERKLLAPFLVTSPLTATLIPTTPVSTANVGTIVIAPSATATTAFPTAAPFTTVSALTPASSFGGDIVRIEAGPGGDFGKGVYAISRGAGENLGAANRPGVIYRVDPATGKSSVFFDLNTVVSQLQPPSAGAANSVTAASGLVNWYDIAFDPEGYFDGRPSMFVTTVDRSDPNKNAVYRIGPDGSFMGAFVQFSGGESSQRFTTNPTSILVPPTENQTFLRGLFAGSGVSTTGGEFSALFFDANAYSPNQDISSTALPQGVAQTNLGVGPQVGLTASNPDYPSRVYSIFTDFGTPAGGGISAVPGQSGVQGNSVGELLIQPTATTTTITNLTIDDLGSVTTPFRRFQDVAFDQYGYFSVGLPLTTTTAAAGAFTNFGTPVSAGNLFVADLATGLQVTIPAIPASPGPPPTPAIPANSLVVPAQFQFGQVSITFDSSGNPVAQVTGGTNVGGRIVRITPEGDVTTFAQGFRTSGVPDASSFLASSLSITFSADGTTLYASDDEGIWQFKTTASLAGSTSGSLIGLNDLRTLGVPYEGQDSAVAIIDSGVDANSSPFRGRVAPGKNIVTNGFGNDDTSSPLGTAAGTPGGGGGGGNTGGGTVISTGVNGHGTLVAGVVAQLVPQATLLPVNIFNPFTNFSGTAAGGGPGGGQGGAGALSFNTNAVASTSNVYQGLKYVTDNPFVNDPVRPNKADRVIAATYGFGSQTTFDSEGVAYRQFPQIVIALKNLMRKYRKLGITPVAAAGQFGNPLGDSGTTGQAGGGGAATQGTGGANNAQNPDVGDSNGISLPAILNEVVSVTGVIPFPYTGAISSTPNDPAVGATPRPSQPLLIGAGVTGTGGGATNNQNASPVAALLQGNTQLIGTGQGGGGATGVTLLFRNGIPQFLYSDRILAAANRNVTTDYAAPAVDVPTFRRTFANLTTTTTGAAATASLDPALHLTFTEGGTSLAAGIVAGSFSLVSSALNYWTKMNNSGTTVDAYLTQPVGARVLNFGAHPFKDLSAYNNPDGINSILAWTAVPASDPNDGISQSQPPYLFGSGEFREIARIDVGNAIAAIEGEIALQYLIDHNILPIIDSNKDNIITTPELQNFVNDSPTIGLPEAGAMARLLGGTERTPENPIAFDNEQPDQPDVLQRRFNFFDYAADGQLNGSVTIDQLRMLAHTLLPKPDAGVINDRQRASVNGFLVDPNAKRNFRDLQHIKPTYQFVPKGVLKRYRNITPDRFGVNRLVRNVDNPSTQFPVWTLFNERGIRQRQQSSVPAPDPANSNTTATQPAATTGGATTGNLGSPGGATTGNLGSSSGTTTGNLGSSSGTQAGNIGTTQVTPGSSSDASKATGAGVSVDASGNTAGGSSTSREELARKLADIIAQP